MTKEQILAEFEEKKKLAYEKLKALGVMNGSVVDAEVITSDWLSQALDKYGAMEYERGRREEGKRCVQIIKNYSIAHADSLTEEEQVYEGTLQEMIEDIEAPSNQEN